MDTLPSDPRQPPDGHEFPDFVESFRKTSTNSTFRSNYATKSTNNMNVDKNLNDAIINNLNFTSADVNTNTSAMRIFQCENEISPSRDCSVRNCEKSDVFFDRKQNDHWNNLVEQRRKGLSKLKGLIIPDSISENDCTSTAINLPEIKSSTVPIESLDSLDSIIEPSSQPNITENTHKVPIITPPWTGNSNFPKYSPAFKRKDLKLYSNSIKQQEISDIKIKPFEMRKSLSTTESSSGDDSTIPLQSLDSSPTRSEVNFEYRKPKQRTRPLGISMETSFLNDYHKNKKEINTEDESDNDSAVSSSQSSFISRPTTSPSPTRSIEYDNVQKVSHLKPSSIEAINRRNILASAKCRSGKDFKCDTPISNEEKTDHEEKTHSTQPKDEKPSSIPQITTKNLPPKPTTAVLKTKFETLAVPLKPQNQTPIVPSRTIINRENTNIPIFKDALKPTPKITKLVKEDKISRITTPSKKSLSVTDLRKSFEEKANTPSNIKPPKSAIPEITRIEEKVSKTPEIKPRKSLTKSVKTTQQSIPILRTRKVVLKPERIGDNLGITLLGGNEENEEITIRRIRYGSVAYQEGTLSKGDRILSINGTETRGLSQDQVMDLLRASVKSFIINVAVKEESMAKDDILQKKQTTPTENTSTSNSGGSPRKANHDITLQKDGSGLGFSIEGGKDSPHGDVPLTIKKIFQGGVAEKNGGLKVGDEILAINDIDFTNFSRIQAWTMMKKIDAGTVKISLYRS